MKETVFMCECLAEGLIIQQDDERTIEISKYTLDSHRAPSFWYRLKSAWSILIGNMSPYDYLVFSRETAKEIADHINNLLNQQ